MNKVAPIVLMLLVVVAAFQIWGTRGGGRVEADGTVSDVDLVEETTTTLGRRTFVDLAPLPDNSVVSTRSRSTAAGPRISTSVRGPATTTRNDDPGGGDRPTTGSTRPPTTAQTTTEPSTPSTPATSEVTPPTTGGGTEPTGGSSTTRKPTTTERPPTTPRPPTTRPPTSQTEPTADNAAPVPGEVAIDR